MAIGGRRFDRKFSNLAILAVAAIVVDLVYQTAPDSAGIANETRTAEPTRPSPRCQEADRATVAQLATFLERNGPADAPILERAIHTLNVARRNCLYDWDGRGLDDYQWLNRWLNEH